MPIEPTPINELEQLVKHALEVAPSSIPEVIEVLKKNRADYVKKKDKNPIGKIDESLEQLRKRQAGEDDDGGDHGPGFF